MTPEDIAKLINENEYTGLEDADEFDGEPEWTILLRDILALHDPLIVFISSSASGGRNTDKIIFGKESYLRKLYESIQEVATLEKLSRWLEIADVHAYGDDGPELLQITLAAFDPSTWWHTKFMGT